MSTFTGFSRGTTAFLGRVIQRLANGPALFSRPRPACGDLDSGHYLNEVLAVAKADPVFVAVSREFDTANVENWLKEEEKSLLFGLAAFAPGKGRIVEIGSYCGASTIFSAAGISRRGQGSVTAIDPHLGAPPWLGTSPSQWTFKKFQENIERLGLSKWVQSRLGDSAALAAIWDATPIDLVFIDGDHSFLGALRDFECFAPKVRAGGLILIDDADDPCVPGVLDLVSQARAMKSVAHLGMVGGIAVFRREAVDAWELLGEIAAIWRKRKMYRPWDMSFFHNLALPSHYLRSANWKDGPTNEAYQPSLAYQLCFLARCPSGAYGYTPNSAPEDREILAALSRDRQDGPMIVLTAENPDAQCRAILGTAEDVGHFARRLLPGGVYLCRSKRLGSENAICQRMTQAGLAGVGFFGSETGGHYSSTHWGIWQPQQVSAEALVEYAVKAFEEQSRKDG